MVYLRSKCVLFKTDKYGYHISKFKSSNKKTLDQSYMSLHKGFFFFTYFVKNDKSFIENIEDIADQYNDSTTELNQTNCLEGVKFTHRKILQWCVFKNNGISVSVKKKLREGNYILGWLCIFETCKVRNVKCRCVSALRVKLWNGLTAHCFKKVLKWEILFSFFSLLYCGNLWVNPFWMVCTGKGLGFTAYSFVGCGL